MKVVQYQLWLDCSSGCKFCTYRGQPDVDKNESLTRIINLIDGGDTEGFDGVGLIGGEIFQKQLKEDGVKEKFYKLTDILVEKLQKDELKVLWVATSLMFKPNVLFEWLDYVVSKGVIDKVMICTSYDLKFRFNDNSLNLWENNMKELHKKYPTLKLHTETILTEVFMNAVMDGSFSIEDFEKEFHTEMDFLEPHTGFQDSEKFKEEMVGFLPKRETFINFMINVVKGWDDQRRFKFLNPEIRSHKIHMIRKGEFITIENRLASHLNEEFGDTKLIIGYCDSFRSIMRDASVWKGVN
jgi:hypothetical protein